MASSHVDKAMAGVFCFSGIESASAPFGGMGVLILFSSLLFSGNDLVTHGALLLALLLAFSALFLPKARVFDVSPLW